MTHDANGPTVSLREAQRLEKKTAQHLYKSRKLSLIVDLDQTIVHATVDPTVGEWIAEGEAWEARRAESIDEKSKANGSEGDDDDDEVNPNWEALKDVKKFRLAPESFAPHSRVKGKAKARVEDEGCLYYIKPRLVSPSYGRELYA
jgi:RNA polymerase II subunit A C-terminal domain phosphatase